MLYEYAIYIYRAENRRKNLCYHIAANINNMIISIYKEKNDNLKNSPSFKKD